MERYLKKEIERSYIQEILGIRKTRFFKLLRTYQSNKNQFSIAYKRTTPTRKIDPIIEANIVKELIFEKELILNPSIPLKSYNYSYIQDRLEKKYQQEVSVPTIINRAKRNGFYLGKPRKKIHARQVLTDYIGQLVQHDSSHHQWSPYALYKWYLITSLDDFSRYMLYAKLFQKESSWAHILALESVFLKHGFPYSYYVDSHSIFRFVQGRDSLWRSHVLQTDDVDPQWKQVLDDCGVKVTYALSPQAKGKIERPYRWLQDRLVRTCARENVSQIQHAQRILDQEVHRYNHHQVHSTTQEIPYRRFQKALKDKKSLFREFKVRPPFISTNDIFCLRLNRTIDAYRRVSINNCLIPIHSAQPGKEVLIRIYPINKTVCELRCWCENKLLDVKIIKNENLKIVHF